MDTSEYLPMFLAEAREHLQELNLAVVRIEESPEDRETVNEIFRIAHSMKGMSATMGYAGMAALTHEMEDVFELLRQRRGGLGREAVDVLLECLDALSAAVESIEAGGDEELDPAALSERLRGLARDRTEEQEVARKGGPAPPPEPERAAAFALDGRRTVRVVVELNAEAAMPAVRAYMVLTALSEHGEVLSSAPTEDAVDGFEGHHVEAWLATSHEAEPILRVLRDITDVADVEVLEEGADADAEKAVAPVAEAEQPEAPAAAAETAQAGRPAASRKSATVRVDAERLDQLMHLMGELVVHRTHLEALANEARVPALQQAMQDLTRSSQALQWMVMQVRMIPVEAVMLRFPRLVRDLSTALGKQVELVLVGKETELDRTVVDALGDPIVHLVRNALDHGLEDPQTRVAAGKPATGRLEISASHAGGNVVIRVVDDGAGIDPERVARKAVERGLIAPDAVETVDAAKAAELLFTPGFSTAETTSDISGRGVGMDAVRTAIRDLGGEVILGSEKGAGTVAEIRLPLTLAIIAALLVEAADQPFAIPLDRVERTLRLSDHAVRSVAGRRMLVLHDRVIPLYDAGETFGFAGYADAHDHAVIVRGRDRRFALAVGRLVGQRELVTRPLPSEVGDRAGASGGAVLSDGRIALIVDCDALHSMSLSAAA